MGVFETATYGVIMTGRGQGVKKNKVNKQSILATVFAELI